VTRFEELINDINKKNKKTSNENNSQDELVKVSGLTGSGSGQPNMEFATEEQDPDLVDQLYLKPKHKPLMGEGAYWNDWE
jgi:hypothetical protein